METIAIFKKPGQLFVLVSETVNYGNREIADRKRSGAFCSSDEYTGGHCIFSCTHNAKDSRYKNIWQEISVR